VHKRKLVMELTQGGFPTNRPQRWLALYGYLQLPKKLGCDVAVKVPVPLLVVWNGEGIVKGGPSSDVMALEHFTTTLHLDSRCGED
jgi:hypothetical protein